MRIGLGLLLLALGYPGIPQGTSFAPQRQTCTECSSHLGRVVPLWDMPPENQEEKLAKLGFSEQELQSRRESSAEEDVEVNVNLIPDVDAASLTAVGFGLIAFNFFVLANLGDGGIGGVVARIINTLNEF